MPHWEKLLLLFLLFVSAVPWLLSRFYTDVLLLLKLECRARTNLLEQKPQRGAEVTEIMCHCASQSAQSMPLVWHKSCSLLSSIGGDHWQMPK